MRSSSAFFTFWFALEVAGLDASFELGLCAWGLVAAVVPTASASAAAIEQSLSVMVESSFDPLKWGYPEPAKRVPGVAFATVGAAGPRRARPGTALRIRRTGSSRFPPRRPRCR